MGWLITSFAGAAARMENGDRETGFPCSLEQPLLRHAQRPARGRDAGLLAGIRVADSQGLPIAAGRQMPPVRGFHGERAQQLACLLERFDRLQERRDVEAALSGVLVRDAGPAREQQHGQHVVRPLRAAHDVGADGARTELVARVRDGIKPPQAAPPAGARAYTFNATVLPEGPLGYLTLWPDGETRPGVSTLNALDGLVTSNMAIVPTTNGSIDAYASSLTQLILDISSYFAP